MELPETDNVDTTTALDADRCRDGGFLRGADDLTKQVLVEQVFAHYQAVLPKTPRALAFLHRVGVDDLELLEKWRVGFSDRTLGKQIPDGDDPDGACLRGQLQRLGLCLSSGGELFRGALTFAQIDADGAIAAAYGERITPRLRSGTPYHLHWSARAAGFFNQAALDLGQEVILCASPLDGLMLEAAGHANVVATPGLRAFDEQHLDAIARSGIRRVVTAFERTPEGEATSRLISQALSLFGISCARLPLPPNHDIKQFVREHGSASLAPLVTSVEPCVQTYQGIVEDCGA